MVYERFQSLSPASLVIEDVEIGADRIFIMARCCTGTAECPDCRHRSGRVHSRYKRRLLDLPSHGRAVRLLVSVRRFRCGNPDCRRQVFSEPLGDGVTHRSARRTSRLEAIVHCCQSAA